MTEGDCMGSSLRRYVKDGSGGVIMKIDEGQIQDVRVGEGRIST